jgi:hypothetical protein
MLFPSKVTSYSESVFPQSIIILRTIKKQRAVSVLELYSQTKEHFDNIDSFISALDFLYAIGFIVFDNQYGRITYAC